MRDASTRAAITSVRDTLDTRALTAARETDRRAPASDGPPRPRVGRTARRDARRPPIRQSVDPARPPHRGHRFRLPRCRRSRPRRSGRVESALDRDWRELPGGPAWRRRDVGARPRQGTLGRSDRAPLLINARTRSSPASPGSPSMRCVPITRSARDQRRQRAERPGSRSARGPLAWAAQRIVPRPAARDPTRRSLRVPRRSRPTIFRGDHRGWHHSCPMKNARRSNAAA